jgi:hypothetical protein
MSLSRSRPAATGIGGKPDLNGLPEARHSSPDLRPGLWALLQRSPGSISAAVWALSSHSGNYHHTSWGARHADLSRRRVPGRRRTRHHRLLREPRTNRQVVVPGRPVSTRAVIRESSQARRALAPIAAGLALLAIGIAIGNRTASPGAESALATGRRALAPSTPLHASDRHAHPRREPVGARSRLRHERSRHSTATSCSSRCASERSSSGSRRPSHAVS